MKIKYDLNHIVFSRILYKIPSKALFCLFETFLKNFNQGQHGLIQIVHLEKFDQFLSKANVV